MLLLLLKGDLQPLFFLVMLAVLAGHLHPRLLVCLPVLVSLLVV